MNREHFGKSPKGEEVSLYTLKNERITARITDFGATLVSLVVKDARGEDRDVVLGYRSLEPYFDNPACMGATIAPCANRTANASYVIDGVRYQMSINDGNNNLHSDLVNGAHKRVWSLKNETDSSLTFELEMADGDLGFPGNRTINVTYGISEGTLSIEYRIRSDKTTVFNPTNHSYFNLSGHDSSDILDDWLKLDCTCFTPVVAGSIPDGSILEVKGTPMDFTEGKTIGRDFDLNYEQLKLTNGYDHNFVIDGYDGTLRHFATLKSNKTGIVLDGYTTMPGVQVYAGNFVESDEGKNGASYRAHDGVCLETQFFPNSANQEGFVSPVINGNEEYCYRTEYRFSC